MLFWSTNTNKIDTKEPASSATDMDTFYQDYDDEPEDVFLPLPAELACSLYTLEMDDFTADLDFFRPWLPKQGTILELGCGNGRITRKMAESSDRLVVGIDISLPMLRLARETSRSSLHNSRYLCMDMTQMAFDHRFSAILIPYNTLNLLATEDNIIKCLIGCRNLLQPKGRLLVELFTPNKSLIHQRKTFQFQMFNRPGGGKIIKEIRKTYLPHNQSVQVEERYRVRPMQAGQANADWHRIFTVAGFAADRWLSLFRKAGLPWTDVFGDYGGNPYDHASSSTILAICTL